MRALDCDVAIIGSGAGGGTVAQALAPLVAQGKRVLLFEKGPRFSPSEVGGDELEMASLLYEDGGGVLTAQGTMTLAAGSAYGGSTVVYTGTSIIAPKRVIEEWNVPGLDFEDVERRSKKYLEQNNVHKLEEAELNDNNRLFREGCKAAGFEAVQFPVNVKGCKGSSLCNLGCPNGAKQGTHRVQLPAAEAAGVEVITRAEVLSIGDRELRIRIKDKMPGEKGAASEWEAGEYRVKAQVVVVSAGVLGTPAMLLRAGFGSSLPALGRGFTCHPALILVAEHPHPITNSVGHPKSYFLDRAEEEGFVLETCMYFPFVTSKSMTGFGKEHSQIMRAFSRLQMILVLGCDKVQPENRIDIDKNGRARVHYHFAPQLISSLVAATKTATRIFFGAGALRAHVPFSEPPLLERTKADRIDELISEKHFKLGKTCPAAAHLMGGCAMGKDKSDSVTDSFGRVHGLPWLYVADASLFPDSVEINPYVTIMALADRVAESVMKDL